MCVTQRGFDVICVEFRLSPGECLFSPCRGRRHHPDVSVKRGYGGRPLSEDRGDGFERSERQHQSAVGERGALSAEEASQQAHR